MKHLKLTLSLFLILFVFLGSILQISAAPNVAAARVGESQSDETDDASNGDAVKNGL